MMALGFCLFRARLAVGLHRHQADRQGRAAVRGGAWSM
jgi:hypothetical protein